MPVAIPETLVDRSIQRLSESLTEESGLIFDWLIAALRQVANQPMVDEIERLRIENHTLDGNIAELRADLSALDRSRQHERQILGEVRDILAPCVPEWGEERIVELASRISERLTARAAEVTDLSEEVATLNTKLDNEAAVWHRVCEELKLSQDERGFFHVKAAIENLKFASQFVPPEIWTDWREVVSVLDLPAGSSKDAVVSKIESLRADLRLARDEIVRAFKIESDPAYGANPPLIVAVQYAVTRYEESQNKWLDYWARLQDVTGVSGNLESLLLSVEATRKDLDAVKAERDGLYQSNERLECSVAQQKAEIYREREAYSALFRPVVDVLGITGKLGEDISVKIVPALQKLVDEHARYWRENEQLREQLVEVDAIKQRLAALEGTLPASLAEIAKAEDAEEAHEPSKLEREGQIHASGSVSDEEFTRNVIEPCLDPEGLAPKEAPRPAPKPAEAPKKLTDSERIEQYKLTIEGGPKLVSIPKITSGLVQAAQMVLADAATRGDVVRFLGVQDKPTADAAWAFAQYHADQVRSIRLTPGYARDYWQELAKFLRDEQKKAQQAATPTKGKAK